jgi:hypothetical protein
LIIKLRNPIFTAILDRLPRGVDSKPMRTLIAVIAVLLTLYAGEWIYRIFLRSIDQPTPELRAVVEHFRDSGIQGNFYPVRHGFRHSSVTAVIADKIDDFALPFTIVDCPSEAAAETRMQSSSPAWRARRNGSLIIHFPMWGEDAVLWQST